MAFCLKLAEHFRLFNHLPAKIFHRLTHTFQMTGTRKTRRTVSIGLCQKPMPAMNQLLFQGARTIHPLPINEDIAP